MRKRWFFGKHEGRITFNSGGKDCTEAGYADGVVAIAVAGTMKELLGDDCLNVTSLKVVGPINGDDVCCLRKMLGGGDFGEDDRGKLVALDLSEAAIVEGGGCYYEGCCTSANAIGDYMFHKCGNLQDIALPDDVVSIGESAFDNCCALAGVSVGDLSSWCRIDFSTRCSNPLYYGARLYLNDKEITQLVIPEGISAIRDYAFYGCGSIASVAISGRVASIGGYAFAYCYALTEVTIGEGVTSIGPCAFSVCSIEVLYCYAVKPPAICHYSEYAFEGGVEKGATLYVPAGCGAAYKSSSWGIYFKNIVEMD